jgi:hypothetical protein
MADTLNPNAPLGRGDRDNDRDAPHLTRVTPQDDARTIMINRVAWGAVFAGVAVALVTQRILNMIGIGIGASTLDPGAGASENPTAAGFSIGAGIWWAVSSVLSALAGGYAAGRLAGKPKESTAGWHGLTTWAMTTLVIFYLLTSAIGGIMGGAYSTLTGIMGGAASTAGSAMQTAAQVAGPSLTSGMSDPFSAIEQALKGTTNSTDPASLRDAAIASMRAALTGNEQEAVAAREQAAQAIAKAQGIPVEQARTQVTQYETQYRQTLATATTKATEGAAIAATTVSRGALLGAIILLLGAVAGWFGGRMGAVDPTVTANRLARRTA